MPRSCPSGMASIHVAAIHMIRRNGLFVFGFIGAFTPFIGPVFIFFVFLVVFFTARFHHFILFLVATVVFLFLLFLGCF